MDEFTIFSLSTPSFYLEIATRVLSTYTDMFCRLHMRRSAAVSGDHYMFPRFKVTP